MKYGKIVLQDDENSAGCPSGTAASEIKTGKIYHIMMAGRCISGDFTAHASYRVGGPAFRTGDAAGGCAAFCIKNGILPPDAVGNASRF